MWEGVRCVQDTVIGGGGGVLHVQRHEAQPAQNSIQRALTETLCHACAVPLPTRQQCIHVVGLTTSSLSTFGDTTADLMYSLCSIHTFCSCPQGDPWV